MTQTMFLIVFFTTCFIWFCLARKDDQDRQKRMKEEREKESEEQTESEESSL